MNAEQHARARATIMTATILCAGYLATDKPRHGACAVARSFVCCGIGELLIGAGYEFEDLDHMPDPDDWIRAYPRLSEVYGLDDAECWRIVHANEDPRAVLGDDGMMDFYGGTRLDHLCEYDMVGARKAAILQVLDSLVLVAA